MKKKEDAKRSKRRWILIVVCLSFGLSLIMSLLTSVFMESAGLFMALVTLLVLVSLGIITDIIGVAVTAAPEQPFIAVASMLIAAFTSAFMIGGKAYGKGIAVEKSETIVLTVGRMMAMFEKKRRCKPKKKKA